MPEKGPEGQQENLGSKPEEQGSKPQDEAIQDVHATWDPFGEESAQGCDPNNKNECVTIPSADAPKETEAPPKGWTKIKMDNLDKVASPGDIVLVGATWCHACKEAKATLPGENPGKKLIYIDYDENEDQVVAKHGENIMLPIKYIYQGVRTASDE